MAPLHRRPGGIGEWHRTVGSSGVNISQSEALAEGERHRQRLRHGETRDEALEATQVGRQAESMRSVAFRRSGNWSSERQVKHFVGAPKG